MTTIHLRDHTNGSDNRVAHRFGGQGVRFFKRKPRLVTNEIVNIPVELTVAWRGGEEEHDPTPFNANVWALKIRNPRLKFSSPTDCSAKLHIKNVGEDFPLRWKCTTEPKKCVIGERPRNGESPVATYRRLMPYNYAVVELAQRHAAPTSSIYIGEEYELYVLYTYDGSDHAFVISPLEEAQWYKDKIFYPRQNFLIFEKGEEREIVITFKSEQNQNNIEVGRSKLRIKFNSWNNVEIL